MRRQQMMAGFGQPVGTDKNYLVPGKGERAEKMGNLTGQSVSKDRGLSKEQQVEAKVSFL